METSRFLEALFQGRASDAFRFFGAQLSGEGVMFRVYAPAARCVKVIGTFNDWSGDQFCMHRTDDGIFELWVEGIKEWTLYQYQIETAEGQWLTKSDPFGFYHELRPKQASIVCDLNYDWHDQSWMAARTKNKDKAMSIYELHLGSWRKRNFYEWMTYPEIAAQLIPYMKFFGFTHVELMPLNEYPFDGSWGYQATGWFSVTSRYGTPKQFMDFVDQLHQAGLGVILDVVPSHFVKDAHGLLNFDGSALYEYPIASDAYTEWGTAYFNYSSEYVRSFMISSMAFWCKLYHVDGLRMDAISNLIYWGNEKSRGENTEALYFMKRMNYQLALEFPAVMLIAEDSSDYQGVTLPTIDGGLGFDYKWDLGWMNDTLSYFELDPVYRSGAHHKLTFSMAYFYTESFILPLSHDEVVHGKKAIIDKMWGSYEQKFAQVKLLYMYMMAHPGKKLNFMGNEIAHFREWDENKEMDWFLLDYPKHQMFQRFFRDLNQVYDYYPALHYDLNHADFTWLDPDNSKDAIYTFSRQHGTDVLVCVFNMLDRGYEHYRIGVPRLGRYIEIMNSQKDIYDGCNMLNYSPVDAQELPHERSLYSMEIAIAPFSAQYFLLNLDDETVDV